MFREFTEKIKSSFSVKLHTKSYKLLRALTRMLPCAFFKYIQKIYFIFSE